MYSLIIAEKPSAAKKIAQALADEKPIQKRIGQVVYYQLTHKKEDIIVASAVGHLYSLTQKEGKKSEFPVFNVGWEESFKVSKKADFSKKYLTLIKKISGKADKFIVACDYDQEGSVIGLNIIRFACKKKDAQRMKFSTLTRDDLLEAYDKRSKTLDWAQAEAGETRHYLDFFNGINYSRALTNAIKEAGSFKIMSTGRVQGPSLKIIVDREKEIKAFKPVPFWQISLLGNIKNNDIEAWHIENKFWDKGKADSVFNKVKNEKIGKVADVTKKQFSQSPPFPFDLTSLQVEAYRTLKIQPKKTLEIAQELYISGYISYPRTSSQQYPPQINLKKIMNAIAKNPLYTKLAETLLKYALKPNNGKKTDPAHPAIYPTGEVPSGLNDQTAKIYDLIVRRFMSLFAEPAIRETMQIDIDVKKEVFLTKGTRTVEKGWHIYYEPYLKLEEQTLPAVAKGNTVNIKKFTLHNKETQPPKRYTPASIIKELERRVLGTKCLTSNNFVKINSNNQIHSENIAELFDDLFSDFPLNQDNMKIAINNKKTCFSFDEFDEIRSHFKLVSKRKLKKNEKVYRIEYNDGSFIETTDDHPMLIFDGENCKYLPAKELIKGMKSVASVKYYDKEGGVICTWEDFLKKCNIKTKLYGISNEILKIRGKRNISQHFFGKKYGIQQSNVCVYENKQQIPLYLFEKLCLKKPTNICSPNKNIIMKNPFPLKMSSPLARILANLVGDCSIDSVKIKRENCYDFRYHNTNINLINRFIKDIRKVFGVDLIIKVAKRKPKHLDKYYVRIPALIGRIISILFSDVINKNAVNIPFEFYPEYIGSLFDDEGHSMKSEQKIFISNTNFLLLEDVKKMLSHLGINAMIDKKQYKLYIRGKENLQMFLERIPILSQEKRQRLINNLSNKYSWKNYPIIKKKRDILALLSLISNKEMTLKEIAKNIHLPFPNVRDTIKSLRKRGYIKKVITGISEYPRKRITYKLVKGIENTFYIYINEQVISPDFITKTIKSIKKINYEGFVYDITNNNEIPNFILSNGVVVHNSTRSAIIDTLFQRGYVHGTPIEATDLGIKTIETLEKYCPKIIDEELTRHFEIELDHIIEGKKKGKEVLDEAKLDLIEIISEFKKQQKAIGQELSVAHKETRQALAALGKCPICKEGELQIRKGKFGSFAACNKYPLCKTTISLPKNALIKPCDKICETCRFPMVTAIKARKKPLDFCLNPKCPTKHVEGKAGEEAKAIAKGQIEKKCPKCKDGKLVLRGSIYGKFYGCSNYPKCKFTEKLENEK